MKTVKHVSRVEWARNRLDSLYRSDPVVFAQLAGPLCALEEWIADHRPVTDAKPKVESSMERLSQAIHRSADDSE